MMLYLLNPYPAETYRSIFDFPYFNIVQSKVFDDVSAFLLSYSKTCIKWPLSKRSQMGFQDQLLLNAGQKYSRMLQGELPECSKGSILQYFQPSLSYHLSFRSLFCLFLSGHFTQVLLYFTFIKLLLVG